MRVNLKQLKLLPGQKKWVTEKIEEPPEWMEAMQAVPAEPLTVKFSVEYTGNYWLIRGMVTAPLKLTCSRCLEEFLYLLEGEFERIAVSADAKIRNHMTGDDTYLLAEEGSADLSQAIEEVLVLNIPMVPLCRENCSGLCPVCGQNLNFGTCHCSRDDVIDPRLEKLKDLL